MPVANAIAKKIIHLRYLPFEIPKVSVLSDNKLSTLQLYQGIYLYPSFISNIIIDNEVAKYT